MEDDDLTDDVDGAGLGTGLGIGYTSYGNGFYMT